MPDISQSSQATLAQALNQLSPLSAASEITRQGVEVLVKHLAGNVLSLNKSSILLDKTVLLNNPQIEGKLADSQTHQVKLSLQNPPTLEFYNQSSAKLTQVITLTQQQLQSLLKLPAKQLIPSNLLTNSASPIQLPSVSATVLPALTKEQISAQTAPTPSTSNSSSPAPAPAPANGQASSSALQVNNTTLANQQNVLRVLLTDQRPLLEVALPVKKLSQFTVGEKVSLNINPRGNNWQLTIIKNPTQQNVQLSSQLPAYTVGNSNSINKLNPSTTTIPPVQNPPNKISNEILQPSAQASSPQTRLKTNTAADPNLPKIQPSLLTPSIALPIIKASLREANLTKPIDLPLASKAVLQQLNKINTPQNQQLLEKLQALHIDKISLKIKQNGEVVLLLQSNKPVANIPITKEIAQAIDSLKLPNQQAVTKFFGELVVNSKQSVNNVLNDTQSVKPANFELPIKAVMQQLNKINHEPSQNLLQKLQGLNIDKIALSIKPNGELALIAQSKKAATSFPLSKEIAQVLAPLKPANHQTIIRLLNQSTETAKPSTLTSQAIPTDVKINKQKQSLITPVGTTADNVISSKVPSVKTPSVDGAKPQDAELSLREVAAKLLTSVQQNPTPQSVITPSLVSNKPEQLNLVQSLLRMVQAKAETPSVTLQSIEKALVDVEFFKGTSEQSTKQLTEQLVQQIKQALPQGKEHDAQQIRQLLSTPALNLSSLQMINPTSAQGLMSGLVTLLQMSLAAKLARTQTSRTEHITETLNNLLNTSSKGKPSITPKAMADLNQLEQKHQLMKEIGRLLSGHQTYKLANAEQMLQGQETFYYNLPSALGGAVKDIELLIKREDSNKDSSSAEEQQNRTWQLTMKLSVGEIGELLTKAKLRSDTLDLNFYASNEAVKIQVMNYLPLLRRKFDGLGIDLTKSHCQLGKIPDSLQQRPYHMFQAKA